MLANMLGTFRWSSWIFINPLILQRLIIVFMSVIDLMTIKWATVLAIFGQAHVFKISIANTHLVPKR